LNLSTVQSVFDADSAKQLSLYSVLSFDLCLSQNFSTIMFLVVYFLRLIFR